MPTLDSFAALGLSEATLAAIAEKGFSEPSEIQAKVIPLLLSGARDIIGQAQTGTGKTAAFGLPLVEKVVPQQGGLQALVLTPTRELAVQVAEEIESLSGSKGLSIAAIYGGSSYNEQIRALRQGVEIIVGTPGRILDHINRGTLSLKVLKYLVLDEADEMLNMGFIEDI